MTDVIAATGALRERLERLAESDDAAEAGAAALDPEMLSLGCTVLTAACTPDLVTADGAALIREVAWLRLFRSDALRGGPEPDQRRADAEEETSLLLFTALHWIQPELVPPSQADIVAALAEAGVGRTEAQRARLLGDALLGLARSTGDRDGIERSVDLYRLALESGDAADRVPALFNMSQALMSGFELSRELSDLEVALAAVREAEQAFTAGDPVRAEAQQNIAQLLEIRFELTQDRGSLDESVQAWQQSLERSEPADPERTPRLTGLSVALRIRYEQTGDRADLEKSITVARQAVTVAAERSAPVSGAMSMLASALSERYLASDNPEDLDEAIRLDRAAVERATDGDRERTMCLNNLGLALQLRFRRNGRSQDLEDSVAAIRSALDGSSGDDQGEYRSSLAMVLLDRYQQSGSLTDLNEAVRAARDAGARPGLRQAERLSNLGLTLRMRFERTRELADIDAAVETGHAAVAAATNTRERGRYLSMLSSSLAEHFKYTVNTSDMDQAIAAGREAVASCPPGHRDRSGALNNLGTVLNIQAGMAGLWGREPEHLDEAVASAREALAMTVLDDPVRPHRMANLAEALSLRFSWTSDDKDAAEALLTAQGAVLLLPAGHPVRASCLAILGRCLHYQQGLGDAATDQAMLRRAFAAWREGTRIPAASAGTRLTCAIRWMRAAQDAESATDVEEAYAAAISILPLLAWHGSERATQEKQLFTWGNLATEAAAWALNAGHPEHAIELLETGRTILWTQFLQTRDEIDDLRAADPQTAGRLDLIRASLDGQGTAELAEGRVGLRLPADRRVQAAAEWDELLTAIRARPGFESFLDIQPFGQMSAAAVGGPVVVINLSQYRCDALAVTPSEVRVIPLPELTLTDADHHATTVRNALSQTGRGSARAVRTAVDSALPWLWRTVTFPVLRELNLLREAPDRLDHVPLPRIWWCPTGPLTHLPVHAAAPSPDGPGAMDHVISSYAPTLRTLARAAAVQPDRDTHRQRLLLVTAPQTLPGRPLQGIDSEARGIMSSFCGQQTRLDGHLATTTAVTEAMAGHNHAHVASHGTIDPEQPAQSGLWLSDGLLTIGALSRLQRRSPGLAFLSACHTAAGSAKLPDETITMAMAMHMARFTHVIATLWFNTDNISPDVARRVYDALSTSDGRLILNDTAAALHAAARNLRNAGFPASKWATYVHSGP